MKRGSPLKRSAPLRTRSRMRRGSPIRARSKTNSHNRRERDFVFMGWVKQRTCIVLEMPPTVAWPSVVACPRPMVIVAATACSGQIEADHMGDRFKQGNGKRAHDRTCVPICRGHHRERHDHAGTFRHLTRDELRAWRTAAIERTQAAWEAR